MINLTHCLFLIGILLISHYSFGAHLAQELAFDQSKAAYWQKRSLELIHIEDYMLRNTHFNQEQLNTLHNFFGGNNDLSGLNHFINTPQNENVAELTTEEIQHSIEQKERIEHILQSLPQLETVSYKGQLISPHIWEELNYDDIYYEKGFFNTVGSLHLAYQDLKNEGHSNKLYKLITKVYGKKGRLAHTIHDQGQSEILWPSQSHFKVIAKDYDRTTDTYYMHLNEIEPKEIKHTHRIISSHDGSQVNINRPSCTTLQH